MCGRALAVADREWTGDCDAHRTAVHALQLACALHGIAEIAPDGLLGNTESVRDVDNIHPSIGGQQVGNRLAYSSEPRLVRVRVDPPSTSSFIGFLARCRIVDFGWGTGLTRPPSQTGTWTEIRALTDHGSVPFDLEDGGRTLT